MVENWEEQRGSDLGNQVNPRRILKKLASQHNVRVPKKIQYHIVSV